MTTGAINVAVCIVSAAHFDLEIGEERTEQIFLNAITNGNKTKVLNSYHYSVWCMNWTPSCGSKRIKRRWCSDARGLN